jgi:integrase
MHHFSPYIKSGYTSNDGTTPLYVRYSYDRKKRTLIYTGFRILPEHWDGKKKWIKRASPQFEKINSALTKLTVKLGKIVDYAYSYDMEPTVDFVLIELEKNREYETRSSRIDLFDTLDTYIEEKGKIFVNQKFEYHNLKSHLLRFKQYSSQPISFRNINMRFYNDFMDYLLNYAPKANGESGLLINSAGKVVKDFKAFVNFQIAKGVIAPVDLSAFKVVQEETDAIYLSEPELATIHALDLSDAPGLEVARDLLIVGCYTGLRYSDLYILGPQHIDVEGGWIRIKQKKVDRAIIIPMIDYVPEILKKHNYNLPKITRPIFSERIKEIGRRAELTQKVEVVHRKGSGRVRFVHEKWELMSSHTCRRSFCTNMYLSGFPAQELMRISGHTTTNAFMRYIKIDNLQSATRLKELRAQLNGCQKWEEEPVAEYAV